jgi:hypothetical protein
MSDFEYITSSDGFTSVFPNTTEATEVYNANEALHVRLLPHEFKGFKDQARLAGYTVRQSKPVRSMDQVLAELQTL